jgi:transposase InsO family protein
MTATIETFTTASPVGTKALGVKLAGRLGRGDCYNYAMMESFWSTLKTELVHLEHYETRQQVRQSIFEYVETFYNRRRLHSSLGYVSPEMFEAASN